MKVKKVKWDSNTQVLGILEVVPHMPLKNQVGKWIGKLIWTAGQYAKTLDQGMVKVGNLRRSLKLMSFCFEHPCHITCPWSSTQALTSKAR